MSIVTLTTDFGWGDGYSGAMKGVILSGAPDATIVDITHAIERHDVAAAAYVLGAAAPYFPPGTIHVVVVDPGVGGPRRPVVIEAGGHLFIGPDNGVFARAAPNPDAVHEISDPRFRREPVSTTFHGRDIFAAAAAALAAGFAPGDAGSAVTLEFGPEPGAGHTIIHIDHFGNLITDIPGDRLGPRTRVRFGVGAPIAGAATYSEVAVGELLAYVGSAGTVEIAVREGSACDRLGAFRGQSVSLRDPDADG